MGGRAGGREGGQAWWGRKEGEGGEVAGARQGRECPLEGEGPDTAEGGDAPITYISVRTMRDVVVVHTMRDVVIVRTMRLCG